MDREVLLRDVQGSDLHIFYEHQRDPVATLAAAFPARDERAFLAHWETAMQREDTTLRTIVFQGAVAGNVVSWEQSGECNVGYWLGREFWGQGIATAALALFLKQVRKRPIFAHVARHNVASIRVLQKCGFSTSKERTCSNGGGEQGQEHVMMLAR